MPAPLVVRELEITYGGFAVGGTSSAYMITDRFRHHEDYEKGSLSFNVRVYGDDEAGFAAACVAFEAAFRKPWQSTVVKFGAAKHIDWSHTGNTGYLANPRAEKVGGIEDSGRSRKYSVTIDVEMPADLDGQGGRRRSTVEVVVLSNGHRFLTVSGAYTALPGVSSKAAYEAGIAAYISAVQSVIAPGGTWDKKDERYSYDDQNKNLEFSRAFEEVDATDETDSGLTDWTLTITRNRTGPGDTPGKVGRRLTTLRASVTGNGPVGPTAVTNWETKTRPWMIRKIKQYFSIGTLAIIDDTVIPSVKDGKISGDLVCHSPESSGTIEYRQTVTISDDTKNAIVPVWAQDPRSAHVFQKPQGIIRTTQTTWKELGDTRGNGAAAPVAGRGPSLGVGIDIASVGTKTTGGGSRPAGGSFSAGIDIGAVGARFTFPVGAAGAAGGAGAAGAAAGGGGGPRWVTIPSQGDTETLIEEGIPGNKFLVTERSTTQVERMVVDVGGRPLFVHTIQGGNH